MSGLLTALVPFGYLDVQRCESILDRFNIGYSDFIEYVDEFCEGTGVHFIDLDICALAYDMILQRVRISIEEFTGKDIENDCGIYVHGNYMCSCYDNTEETTKLLESKAGRKLRESDPLVETFYRQIL